MNNIINKKEDIIIICILSKIILLYIILNFVDLILLISVFVLFSVLKWLINTLQGNLTFSAITPFILVALFENKNSYKYLFLQGIILFSTNALLDINIPLYQVVAPLLNGVETSALLFIIGKIYTIIIISYISFIIYIILFLGFVNSCFHNFLINDVPE